MNTTQLPFLVEGILILATTLFGIFTGRAGKPYGRVKLSIHLFFYLWFTVGFAFIVYSLLTINPAIITWVPVAMMGLMILTQLVTGILMLANRIDRKTLPAIHIVSTSLLFLSDICAFFIIGNRS